MQPPTEIQCKNRKYNIYYEVIDTAFKPKPTKNKIKSGYKTLYISDEPVDKLNKIAADNDTGFNNIVISIIEDFFERKGE